MRAVKYIFVVILKEWIRSPSGVFFSLLFPLFLFIVLSTVFGGSSSVSYELYVLNLDLREDGSPTNLSKAFIEALNSTESFKIRLLKSSVNVSEFLNRSDFSSRRLIVIPRGFEDKAINRTVVAKIVIIIDMLKKIEFHNESVAANVSYAIKMLQYYLNQTNSTSPEILFFADQEDPSTPIVKGILYSVIQSFNGRLTGATEIVSIDAKDIQKKRLKAADYYLPSFIASFIMTNGIIGMTSLVSDYKRRGILKRLSCTPLKKYEWILGCILQQAFLGFIITIIMIAFGYLLFGIRALPDVYSLLLIFIGAVAFSSVGIAMGGVVRPEAASAFGNAISFPLMFLSGAFWPVEIMPPYMQTVAKLTPLYYFHQGLRETLIYGNVMGALSSFIILSIIFVVFVVLAERITKWKDF